MSHLPTLLATRVQEDRRPRVLDLAQSPAVRRRNSFLFFSASELPHPTPGFQCPATLLLQTVKTLVFTFLIILFALDLFYKRRGVVTGEGPTGLTPVQARIPL